MTRPESRVWFSEWACGCGSPQDAARFVHDVLEAFRARHDGGYDRAGCEKRYAEHRARMEALLPNSGVEYFVLYVLDHWGLLEHGGSVGGSWLTDKGKDVLAALKREAADDFQAMSDSCCIHGYSDGVDCPECEAMTAHLH